MKLLKFGAPWCGSCKKLSAMISSSNLRVLVEVVEIDVEDSSEMVRRFGVRNLPTMVLVTDCNEELSRWVGVNNNTINDVISTIRSISKIN